MAERDVLICGCCFTQFSDLKIFIDHKQNCGVSSASNVCSFVSTAQPTSHFGSQQIVLPSHGHASVVSLPIGVPHVLFQTSSGLSQMYRLVLEPSTQINSSVQYSPTSQISSVVHEVNNSGVETQYGISSTVKASHKELSAFSLSKKEDVNEKVVSVGAIPISVSDSSVTRLTLMNPVDSSWTAQRNEPPTSTFENLDCNISDKSSNLHTEEEVTTFLATQLVSQTANSNLNTKLRENSTPKCNILLEDPSSNQSNLNFLEPTISIPVQGKREIEAVKKEKYFTKTNIQKNVFEDNIQCLEGNEIDKRTKKIVCSYENCKFSTMHKKDMVRHVRKHTGEKPYQCPECGRQLSRQDKLKVHLRTHSKEKPYACMEPGCSYRANEKAHLKKHIRTHTNERPFRCQFCSYGARDGSHLTVHLRSHTGDAPFHCQMDGCAATFKTSSDLKRHERLHTGEKPFKCSECDYASSLKANLKVHFRINHTKGEKFSCSSCPFIANSRKQVKEHEISHSCLSYLDSKEHEKKLPKRDDFTEDIDLLSHAKQISHLADASGKKIGLSKGRRNAKPFCPKNFKCEECGSGFVREDSFRSHVRQHERKRKESEIKATPSVKGGIEEISQKGKGKSVFTLNYILQGASNNGTLSRCTLDSLRSRSHVQKDSKVETIIPVSGTVNITSGQNILEPTTIASEVFPTYMIAVDGMPSVYSAATLPKESQLPEDQSLGQDDPVVHILSSPISHSIQPSVNSKIISLEEEINVEHNIT